MFSISTVRKIRFSLFQLIAVILYLGLTQNLCGQESLSHSASADSKLLITPSQVLNSRDPEVSTRRIMVKLSPLNEPGRMMVSGELLTDDAVISKIKTLHQIVKIQPHFPQEISTSPGSMILNPKGESIPTPDLTRWLRVEVKEGTDIEGQIKEILKIEGVQLAEPDYLRRASTIPSSSSDPLYSQQWHLAAANIPQAWAHLQAQGLSPGGNRNIIVAVIDTGVDLTHQDLAANLWTNTQDGSHGFNAITNTNNPQDDHGHGTHVAGIIAAQANNGVGGVGVAYNVQIMPIKSAQYSGILSASDIASGIYFAVRNGADVINMSFGGYGKSTIEEDALAIAFGQAVLVASAGNDGLPNELYINARPMYPAAYNWVLGVMASRENPSSKGDYLAGFSNWDVASNNLIEYELMAPGVEIMGTLPNNHYGAWSGTSMSAPIVSGIAALVRTKYLDKNTYSSRFIMGQIATTGSLRQGLTLANGTANSYYQADALRALTTTPKPQLYFQQYWIFDPLSLSSANNNNGRVNAGEDINLGLQIRNQWGNASNIQVKIEPLASGASSPDPYVTMLTSTVNYGTAGAFSNTDNLIRENGIVTGASNPFKFRTQSSTPNSHVIPFKVTITAKNGFDTSDTTVYTSTTYFYITVLNGEELPRTFNSNRTLTKDKLWIVSDQVLIPEGVTVTVDPGTKIQFYSTESRSPLALDPSPRILVKGTLNVAGTLSEPVQIILATGYEARNIEIHRASPPNNQSSMMGSIVLTYTIVNNPSLRISTADHCEFRGNGFIQSSYLVNGSTVLAAYRSFVHGDSVTRSRFKSVGHAEWTYDTSYPSPYTFSLGSYIHPNTGVAWGSYSVQTSITESLFENSVFSWSYEQNTMKSDFKNNVLLNSTRKNNYGNLLQSQIYFNNSDPSLSDVSFNHHFSKNATLEPFINLKPNSWLVLNASSQNNYDISQNFWGANSQYIDAIIRDFNDDVFKGILSYTPVLNSAATTTYPFVVSAIVKNASGQVVDTLGSQTATLVVTFNRDMDQSIQPAVGFGPAEPYTDYRIEGSWLGPREWIGTFTVSALTGDGDQFFNISGAVAANDPWLITGKDSARFQVKILTAGTNAMSLQATGGEGKVDLVWTQNDFDVVAGYNLYRSTSQNGSYSRINPTLIPDATSTYRDSGVTPGQQYFYKFTIVKTDLTESQPSNIASATPLDTILPVITHSPLTSALPGLSVSISASITDNVLVSSASLYYRNIGTTLYTSVSMTKTTGNNYSATLAGSLITSPGFEYYLSASDGINTASAGRAEYPYQVIVVDKPVITTISPVQGPSSGGTTVTISGSNFKTGARVTFGGAAASSVTIISSSQITCVTPTQVPSVTDVIVTNTNNASSTHNGAFTFVSTSASLSIPNQTSAQNSIVSLPINAAVVNGLVAADFTVTFNASVLKPRTVTTGSLTTGWTVTSNNQTSGQVRVSMISGGGAVFGSGVLAQLEFEVVGNPGTSSALVFSTLLLNAGSIPVSLAAGSLTVTVAYDISGTVRHWKSNAAISDVYLETVGDKIYSSTTGNGGAYSITNLPPAGYTVRPSKSSEAQGITAYDGSLILQHATGLITLTGSQAVAADVDSSGSINAMDAYFLLQKAAGLISLPFNGTGTVWKFSPSSKAYSNLSSHQTAQDYVGILVGDVSGNWTAQEAQAGAPSNFKVTEGPPASDRSLTASIAVNPRSQNLYSMDVTLIYDASKGTPISITPIGNAVNWTLASNLNTPGMIALAMASATPMATEGNMVSVKFNLLNSHQEVSLKAQGVLLNGSASGNFTMEDVTLVMRFINGEASPTQADLAKYDVGPMVSGNSSSDGKIDIVDLVIILRSALGLGL